MRRLSTLLFIVLASVIAQAQAPANYYNTANGKTGEELLDALHSIIGNHTPISYDNIWTAFRYTDPRTDDSDKVWDMYSDIPGGTPKLFTFGDNQCGNYSQEGDCYNREHSWPKSWFGGNENSTPGRDLHHVFPTDGWVNAQRGDLPFGEVSNPTYTSHNGSKVGPCTVSGYTGNVFEPIDEYKGDFARAYFYMSVRYHGEDDGWSTSGMTNKSEIKPWAMTMLLQWNDEDPVSDKERNRNNVIYNSYQYNRNPFIDHPEYARMIWDPNWTPTVSGDYVKVTNADDLTDGEYLIVYEDGGKAFNGSLTTLDATNNYIAVTITNGTISSTTDIDAAVFSITKSENSFTIQSASGYYIGQASDANGLASSTTDAYTNAITFSDGNAVIVSSGGAYLRYNSSSNQERFRYYKSNSYTNQKAIQLYKKSEAPVAPFEQRYYLVTSTDQLVAGRTYLIVNKDAGKAISTTQNNNNRAATAVSISNDTIEAIETAVCELTLGGSTGAWTFFDANWGNNGGYLYASSSSSNNLKTQAENNANGQWSISIENGTATIVAQGTNTRNNLRYNPNNNNPIFSCYASASDLAKVELFIRSEEDTIKANTTLANLLPFDKHVISNGTTLTVTGTAECDDPSLLIIEEGGQFIHHNDGVQATFKKSIEAYTNDQNGWYTIASPFTTLTPSQLATGNYDLYAYDEDGENEWVNYKAHITSGFPTGPENGFLYAHSPRTTLSTTGTLNSGDYTNTVNLSYANSNTSLRGFNLLGNPTAHDITFSKTDNISNGYYYLSNHDTWQYTTSNVVPAGRGFLVKANATGQSVTLNPQSRGEFAEDSYLCVTIDNDKAYVKMDEGVSMPLLDFRGKSSSVYLTRDGKPYIMLTKDDANTIDLCFKPTLKGEHTLTLSSPLTSHLSPLTYLHLIDHLTGADIDLLSTPSYSFESSNSDYPSRFQLRFTPNNDIENGDNFAFINNDNLIITGEGTLQIFDAIGRQVFVKQLSTLNAQLSTLNFPSGVYILKLISSGKTKIQKIIINK